MNLMCVYLVAHEILHWVGPVYINFEILYFTLSTDLLFEFKIIMCCLEQTSRHSPVKYLSIWMILEFSHKLIYSH